MQTYIHQTAQRLRVRSDFIRHNPKKVAELITQLVKIEAISDVKHKKYAGSVAICFDEKELECDDLLELIESHGWTKTVDKASFIENAAAQGVKTFAKGIAVMTLRQLVSPSIINMIKI